MEIPSKNSDVQKMYVTKMRMLRCMIREPRLRWFEHVQRKCVEAPMRKCKGLVVEGTHRGRSRPKKYWERLEPRVFRKQPLYLHEVVIRSTYTLPSPDLTYWDFPGYVVVI
ncbi:hypothetical protein H5410_058931 [Solanum commersonii]|uniref:Uncharacterized protein n=1 Tax=Solanum commersonii TaxID=4109 RepID=A0A9J5W100_SOLCO|nr:hypothetical protein H5410_058931 [Solanum commersonii]